MIVTSRLREDSGLPERVQNHLQTWVDGLGLVEPPRLRLKLRHKEDWWLLVLALLPSSTTRGPPGRTVLLGLTGLLLLVAGASGLALGLGAFGSARADQPVISSGVTDAAASHCGFWPLVAMGAAVMVALAGRWLLPRLRTDRVRAFDMEPDRSRGRTILHTGAVVDAVRRRSAATEG